MSGLFASLNSSVSAIQAHSRALEIAGKNLANVNNTGYARQRIVYGDRGTVLTPQGAESLGLEALGVEQLRDSLLDRQVLRETSISAGYTAQQSAYQRAQASLGQSIKSTTGAYSTTSNDTGIGAALDNFFNAFQTLATNPTDHGERQSLLQSAAILTDRVQIADQRLAQTQSDLDSQIGTDISSANGLLTTIANLNEQIKRFEVRNPGSAVDLRDQRQTALEKLAGYVAFDSADTGGGQIEISVRDTSGTAVTLVSGANVAANLGFNGTSLTAGGSAITISGGSAQGALDARNGPVQQLRTQLDALAKQIVTSVNTAYQSGGSSANFFNPSGVTAGTIKVATGITAASLAAGTGAAGDNSIALAIAGLANQKFSTTSGDVIEGTFSGYFASAVSDLGQSLASANARVSEQTSIQQIVTTQRNTVSGVSLDEEMADLVKFQRAFQASSRVFQTINELLDSVISQMGR